MSSWCVSEVRGERSGCTEDYHKHGGVDHFISAVGANGLCRCACMYILRAALHICVCVRAWIVMSGVCASRSYLGFLCSFNFLSSSGPPVLSMIILSAQQKSRTMKYQISAKQIKARKITTTQHRDVHSNSNATQTVDQ